MAHCGGHPLSVAWHPAFTAIAAGAMAMPSVFVVDNALRCAAFPAPCALN